MATREEALRRRTSLRAAAICALAVLALLQATLSGAGAGPTDSAAAKSPCRPAIGYYIVVGARFWAPRLIRVTGASNLPAGSVLTIWVLDTSLRVVGGSDRAAAVAADGLFSAEIGPKPGLSFDPNKRYLCSVVFQLDPRIDPPEVIKAVGLRGARLGQNGVNPEVGKNSGGWYLSEEALVN